MAEKIIKEIPDTLEYGVPHYVVLGKWTERGIKNLKDIPTRIENTRKMIEKSKGKMTLYYTLGEFDFVMIVETPNEESIFKILLWLANLGNIQTTTLKAWTESDGKKVIAQLR